MRVGVLEERISGARTEELRVLGEEVRVDRAQLGIGRAIERAVPTDTCQADRIGVQRTAETTGVQAVWLPTYGGVWWRG